MRGFVKWRKVSGPGLGHSTETSDLEVENEGVESLLNEM